MGSREGTLATLLDPPAAGAAGHDENPVDARSTRRKSKWVAAYEGFNLHVGTTVAAGHRTFLERLLRLCARPAFALDRLARLPDGRFSYRMKYPLHGHTHRILEPMELMARLASIVPPPRFPLVRFAGVFASGSPWRKLVVPAHPPSRRCCAEHDRERTQSAPVPAPSNAASAARDETDPVIAARAAPAAVDDGASTPRASPLDRARRARPRRHENRLGLVTPPRARSGSPRVYSLWREDARSVRRPRPGPVRRVLEHLGERTAQRVPFRAGDPVPVDDLRKSTTGDDRDQPFGHWN